MALYGNIELPGKPDLENIRKLDLLPMSSIMEMQKFGMAVDVDKFRDISKVLQSEMVDLKSEICSYIPESKLEEFIARSNLDDADNYTPMNVNSNRQLCELMFKVLGIGNGKELKYTSSGKEISTGRRQLEKLRLDHPLVGKVLNYREVSKLDNTYARKLPEIARLHPSGKHCPYCGLSHREAHYRIHTTILSTRTNTGRYASKDPNLQNIPIRSKHGADIRRGFIASTGNRLVSCDFSQIELRMLAFIAKAKRLIKIFLDGLDPHTQMAMDGFGISEAEVLADKIRYRNPAKNVNFAIVFGETAKGLYEQLVADSYGKAGIPVPDWLTMKWCEEFLIKWFKLNPEVLDYMEEQNYRAYRYGLVWDMFGRIRLVPEVKSYHKHIAEAGLRQAGNMPIQATAAGLIKLAIAEIQELIEKVVRKQGIYCIPVMTIHDELILEVQEDYAEPVKDIVEGVFSKVLMDRDGYKDYCTVPILADGKVMEEWSK